MTTLHALTSDLLALADRLSEGELTVEDEAMVEATEEALSAKAAGYLAVARQLDTEAEGMRGEARRLSEMAAKREAGAARLRSRLAYCMDLAKIDRLPTPLGTLRVQQASKPSFEWEGEGEIPEALRTVVVSFSKTKAWDLWRMTKQVPEGVRVVYSRGLRVG